MRRLVVLLILAAALTGAAAGAAPAPAHLLVDAQEWSLWPSRPTVPAGRVDVELWNRGEDPHDLGIRPLSTAGRMVGPVLGRVRVTLPGKIGAAVWRLSPGRYEIFCMMPGHMGLGMHARITVL